MDSLGDAKRGSLFYKPCTIPNFKTLPLHFISWHPSPTQHLPRYLRCTSFPFVSCRSLTSSLTTPLGFFSWGTLSPVYQPSHGDITSPLYTAVTATVPLWLRPSARAGTGHVANTSSCCGATACPPGSRNGGNESFDAPSFNFIQYTLFHVDILVNHDFRSITFLHFFSLPFFVTICVLEDWDNHGKISNTPAAPLDC